MALTPSRRSELRSQAHKLSPVVIIGDKGLTDEVLAEIDRSLTAHELIKIRAATDDRGARGMWMEKICAALGAHAVQQIGKVLVVYRENFDKPREKQAAPAALVAPKPKRHGLDDPRKKKVPEPRARPRGRGAEDDGKTRRRPRGEAIRTSHPRSRTPSPLPESGLRRRRRSTSR